MSSVKKLKISAVNLSLQEILSKELKISKILAQILINRGLTSPKEAEKFLKIKLDNLLDPYLFSDMPKAVEIIRKAAKRQDKVMIFGDYDVDGVTSVALLKSAFSKIGIEALHYLPHRVKEGYGLSKDILRIAKEKNIKLLVTVDCGTSSDEEIKQLRHAGIEVVITDHHQPANQNASHASAMINPKVAVSNYSFKDLAGVGVAYKLAQALLEDKLIDDLDLVSLGTIADVVPLNGENRIIAKLGLEKISSTKREGLRALIETSGIKNKKINSTTVSFILGPRINASGRVDSSEVALKLLVTEDSNEAMELAKLVEGFNRQRQKIEGKIMEEALLEIEREVNFKDHKIIVVANQSWHQGVLGVVASKIADRFYRPTIIISENGKLSKGSGRSIKNFHLFDALLDSQDLLNTFGGHSHAVGLVIDAENIKEFRNKINRFAHTALKFEDLLPSIEVDMELGLGDISQGVVNELETLEPFGTGNPQPLFYSKNLKLKSEPQVLGRETLKFWITDGKDVHQAIAFGKASFKGPLMNCESFDLVYTPRIDSWQEQTSIILEIKEIYPRTN